MNERVSARRGGAVSARDAQDCKLCNSLTCGNVQPKRGGGFEKYRSGLFFSQNQVYVWPVVNGDQGLTT